MECFVKYIEDGKNPETRWLSIKGNWMYISENISASDPLRVFRLSDLRFEDANEKLGVMHSLVFYLKDDSLFYIRTPNQFHIKEILDALHQKPPETIKALHSVVCDTKGELIYKESDRIHVDLTDDRLEIRQKHHNYDSIPYKDIVSVDPVSSEPSWMRITLADRVLKLHFQKLDQMTEFIDYLQSTH